MEVGMSKIDNRNTLINTHGLNREYYRELKKVYLKNQQKVESINEHNKIIKEKLDNIEKVVGDVKDFAVQMDLFSKEDYTLKPDEFALLPKKENEKGRNKK